MGDVADAVGLRKPGNLFAMRPSTLGMRAFLEVMREAGTMRADVDTRAVAYLLESLTPALRATFSTGRDAAAPDRPTSDELLETIADLLDRALTPDDADLAHGKQVLLRGLDESAGVLFTADPLTGARDRIMVNAAWGLGEAVVGGQVTPDTWPSRAACCPRPTSASRCSPPPTGGSGGRGIRRRRRSCSGSTASRCGRRRHCATCRRQRRSPSTATRSTTSTSPSPCPPRTRRRCCARGRRSWTAPPPTRTPGSGPV
ncbi:PEP/pyruvate-binding domain-containing protein [Nonomuraea sp. NPDC055795]